jgi:hypothetical protein
MIAVMVLFWIYFIPVSCIRAFSSEVDLNKLAREVAASKMTDPEVPPKSIIVSSISRETVQYLRSFNCRLNRLHMRALLVAFDDMSYNYTKTHFSTNGTGADYASVTAVLWRGSLDHGFKSNRLAAVGEDVLNHHSSDVFYAEKLTIMLALLELGYDVLYTDITLSIQRNPFASIPNNKKISFLHASDEVSCTK